jgi:apolipoprotein N-acyltransferase
VSTSDSANETPSENEAPEAKGAPEKKETSQAKDAPVAKETPQAKETSQAASKAPRARKPWVPIGALLPRVAYPLAILSGLLYFLGFPGMDLWPLSFVAFVPLIIALDGQPVGRATALGWTAGFTMTMTGFYWLLDMLKVFSGFPLPVCMLFMAILCAYQAGRIALAGWLYARATVLGWPAPIVFALAFAGSELIYPLLFPWYFGASVHNAPALMQVADLGGPILVGLVLVAANLALAEIAIALRRRRAISRSLVAIGIAVPALSAVYGSMRIASVDTLMAASKTMKLGIVQGNMPLFDRGRALATHVALTRKLKAEGVELVVWSEAAVPRSLNEARYAEDVQRNLTRNLGVATIVGTVLRRSPAHEGGRIQFFNTALFADAQGQVLGRYDKQYLLAFGEYLPLGDTFPVLYQWSPNSGRFTPGETIEPLVWGEHRISALICYEDILPSFVRQIVRHADPDLLVNMTNDAWFGDSTEPWIHLALSKLRAVEHRRYLVRATNSGVSAIVDAAGRVVTHGGTFREETVTGEIRWMRQKTLYGITGDMPWYVALIVIGVMAFVGKPRR